MRYKPTLRSLELKESILASFVLERAEARERLVGFDEVDWLSVLWWLDISCIALYFIDRMVTLGLDTLLPYAVHHGLSERLKNNRIRAQALFEESCILTSWFEEAGIPYAVLKGITLVPHSVPASALRVQTDLDLLVAANHAELATHYIHRLGYRLHASSGNTFEYRAGMPSVPDLANLYSVHTQRSLELHVAQTGSVDAGFLDRRVPVVYGSASIYCLSPADILVQQALHLLKHLCGEHTRISWILEFSRHVEFRRNDYTFLRLAERRATDFPNADLAMAISLWLSGDLFSCVDFDLPRQWRNDAIPPRVRLWLERYARSLLLNDAIGSKLYALLREQLPRLGGPARTTRQILWPRAFPGPLLQARPGEGLADRCSRYAVEVNFFMRRLWFHVREGVRFALESSRWNRTVARGGR